MPSHYITNLMKRAKSLLPGRTKMSSTRKKKRKFGQEGEGGEKRSYKVDEKSPVGKAQARNRKVKSMLDQLD